MADGRAPGDWRAIRRILVVRLNNIGDVVMLGPALRAVRAALPGAEVTLLAAPAGALAAPMLPWVDEVLVHRAIWQDASGAMALDPGRESALAAELRSRRFDAALIFTSFSQSPYPPAYACYLAGIPIRVGQSKEFGGSVLSRWVRPLPDGVHQVDRNLHLLESIGFAAAGRHLELRVPAGASARADELLRAEGIDPEAPFLVVAPGASCAARRYDPARFAAAVRLLDDRAGMPIVVVGSERERELAAPIGAGTAARSLVGRTSIPELTAILRRARLVLANDSGPMHLADAFGRLMVILYSGTELEAQWRPRGSAATLLRRPTDCAPCHLFRCPYRMECLDFAPDEVVRAVLDQLERTEAGAPALAQAG